MANRRDGVLGLYIGLTRSGKSTPIKKVAVQHERALVFDQKGEYGALGFQVVDNRADLLKLLRESTGAAKIAYFSCDKKDFHFWCDCAFNWNVQKESLLIAEELANVTNSGKAEGAWGRLLNQSLGFGAVLLGTVQRGQEVDKTIMGNATYLHVAQQQTDDDVSYIAKKLGVDVSDIPREPLKFIVWRSGKGLLVRKGTINYKSLEDKSPKLRGIKRGSNSNVLLTINKDGKFKGVEY